MLIGKNIVTSGMNLKNNLMKRKEMRELTIYYCDWCMEELDTPMRTVYPKYEKELHFHEACYKKREQNSLRNPDSKPKN